MEQQTARSWGLLAVCVVWAVRGVDLQHSDLVVQRTLVSVRRNPTAFPSDLVADHAVAHPGLWLDILALVPDLDVVYGGIGLLCTAGAAALCAALARRVGASPLGTTLAAVAILLPRMFPGWVELMPAAPLSRAAVIPAVAGALWLGLSGRAEWAGVVTGIAIGLHPAVGLGAAVMVIACSGRPLRTMGLAFLCAVPSIGPSAVYTLSQSFGDSWWAITAARWGHHLEPGAGWSVLGAGVLVLALGAGVRAEQRVAQVSGSALVVVAVALAVVWGVRTGGLPAATARLHPWHWCVAPFLWALVVGLRQASRTRWGFGWACVALLAGVQGTGVAWRGPPPPLPAAVTEHLAGVDPRRPILLDPRRAPWVRLQSGRAVVATIKDGAEVVASPIFAQRWAANIHALCGLAAPPSGRGPGWIRYRRACTWPPSPETLLRLAKAYRPAVIWAVESPHSDWMVLDADGDGVWLAVP